MPRGLPLKAAWVVSKEHRRPTTAARAYVRFEGITSYNNGFPHDTLHATSIFRWARSATSGRVGNWGCKYLAHVFVEAIA